MRPKRKRAQAILEYVILFGLLTAIVAVTLVTVFSGSGQFQDTLKKYLNGN